MYVWCFNQFVVANLIKISLKMFQFNKIYAAMSAIILNQCSNNNFMRNMRADHSWVAIVTTFGCCVPHVSLESQLLLLRTRILRGAATARLWRRRPAIRHRVGCLSPIYMRGCTRPPPNLPFSYRQYTSLSKHPCKGTFNCRPCRRKKAWAWHLSRSKIIYRYV